MRLAERTDYALRVLMVLASDRRRHTVPALAESLLVSANHLTKVVQLLHAAAWVRTAAGRGGGVELDAAPDRLSVGAVVRTIEPDFQLVECLRAGGRCPLSGPCRLVHALRDAQDAFLGALDGVTILDLVEGSEHSLLELSIDSGGP